MYYSHPHTFRFYERDITACLVTLGDPITILGDMIDVSMVQSPHRGAGHLQAGDNKKTHLDTVKSVNTIFS